MSIFHKNGLSHFVRTLTFSLLLFFIAEIVTADDLGDTQMFATHNFQFFAYDYTIGATLQEISDHAYFYTENAVVVTCLVDETDDFIYIGTAHGGVFRRGFTETAWTSISNGLPNDADRGGFSLVRKLLINSNDILIAGTDRGVYSLSPTETTWRRRGSEIPIFDMLIDGDNVYAATGHYLWDADDDEDGDIDVNMGVRYSSDGGLNWSNISIGLPVDEDDETVEVYSLAKSGSKIFAATTVGMFFLATGTNYWQTALRPLTLSTSNVIIPLAESSRDEAQMGGDFFRWYYRWLTIDAEAVAPEAELVITYFPSTVGDEDTVSQWVCLLEEGILNDENKLKLELSSATGFYNVPGLFFGYEDLTLDNIRYGTHNSVATIINPRTEVLLLAADATDPNYEIGGQFVTVLYANDNETFKWSVRCTSLREPNKDMRGLLLSNDNIITAGEPDYILLNDPSQLQYFSASTVNNMYNFIIIESSLDGNTLFGITLSDVFTSTNNGATWTQLGPTVDDIIFDLYDNGSNIYLGTSSGVYAYNTDDDSWDLLPYIIPYSLIPTTVLSQVGGNLVAGGTAGFSTYSEADLEWESDNLHLFSYLTVDELDTLTDMMESVTPGNPSQGIYQTLTDKFGADRFPDIDNSDIITVLLHNIHDRSEPWNNTSNGSEGGIDAITGYVRFEDQSLVGRTNRRDMVYIDTKDVDIDERGAALAHQLMRLMMLNPNYDYDEERWIFEGIAFFGEKLCGFDMPSIWVDYAQASTASKALSLVSGTPLVRWGVNPNGGSAVAELYTKSAVWITYLEENLGGSDFISALMDEPANGIEGINNLLPNFSPAGHTDLTFSDVFSAWSIANAVNNNALVDQSTGLRYGYQDSSYAAMINSYRAGNGDSTGIKVMPLQPDASSEIYDKIRQPSSFTDGLNNWATVFRTFFTLPSTGGPKAWAGKTYHFNGADGNTFRLWKLKHNTIGGSFVVEEITAELNNQNELIFDILNEFGSNADTTVYEFDKIIVAISNQSPLGGSARYIQTTDVTPPDVEISIVHNAFYPEFITIFVYTNEHLHADVDQPENPKVYVSAELDTSLIEMALYQDMEDTAGNYSGSLYRGELQLRNNETLNLFMDMVQDLPGNSTTVPAFPVTVGKVAGKEKTIQLVTQDKKFNISLPGAAMANNSYLTVVSESPVIHSKMHNVDLSIFEDIQGIFTVGPASLLLYEKAQIMVNTGSDVSEKTGIYTFRNGQWFSVPAVLNLSGSTLSASIDRLGTFLVAKSGRIAAETVLAPESYGLDQNYPNPFNPNTKIKYRIANGGKTTVYIYDLLGKEVKTLIDTYQSPGYYELQWDGLDQFERKVGSGVYFYRLQSDDFQQTKKMLIIK